ncbi:MAG: hypothetical protein ACK5NY_06880 [Burkholderiaceae bacterium]|jgi:hypothetical protein
MNRFRPALLTVGLIACLCLAGWWFQHTTLRSTANEIILLSPDTVSVERQGLLAVWQDAAAEEGIPLKAMRYSDWIRQRSTPTGPAHANPALPPMLIVPDGLFRAAPEPLADALRRFVSAGGFLFLVHDAVLSSQSNPDRRVSQMADLAGVDYQNDQDVWNVLLGREQILTRIGIPPGRFSLEGEWRRITGYIYDEVRFPGLKSATKSRGKVLLQFADGRPAAIENRYGRGKVLFVNLPLGHLKQQTDGGWLHGMLSYFARDMAHLPYLSNVPDGVGGMTLNFHCDAKICEKPLRELTDMGIFEHGPFSIHVTAGPGQNAEDDGKGLDLDNNPSFQKFLKSLAQQGHALGSHGGWIHDEFASAVDETNERQFLPYLEKNKRSIERLTGAPQREYSSPYANTPRWVVRWLEKTGVKAYYTTANIGMGPTRSWSGTSRDQDIWSFPVQSFGAIATAEDAVLQLVPESQLSDWFAALIDFCVESRVTRLVYFHPPGAIMMPNALRTLIDRGSSYEKQGRFKWRTLTELAEFLDKRATVQWRILPEGKDGLRLEATRPGGLQHMAWFIDRRVYEQPAILAGQAQVFQNTQHYRVVVQDGGRLQMRLNFRQSKNKP